MIKKMIYFERKLSVIFLQFLIAFFKFQKWNVGFQTFDRIEKHLTLSENRRR